jgi:hypothetical protein
VKLGECERSRVHGDQCLPRRARQRVRDERNLPAADPVDQTWRIEPSHTSGFARADVQCSLHRGRARLASLRIAVSRPIPGGLTVRTIAVLTVIGVLASAGAALAVSTPPPSAYSYYYGLTRQGLHVTVILQYGKQVEDMHYNVHFTCKDGTSGVQTFDWPFSKSPIPIKHAKFSGTDKGIFSSATTFDGTLNGTHIAGSFTLHFKQSSVKCSSGGAVAYKTTRGALKSW